MEFRPPAGSFHTPRSALPQSRVSPVEWWPPSGSFRTLPGGNPITSPARFVIAARQVFPAHCHGGKSGPPDGGTFHLDLAYGGLKESPCLQDVGPWHWGHCA